VTVGNVPSSSKPEGNKPQAKKSKKVPLKSKLLGIRKEYDPVTRTATSLRADIVKERKSDRLTGGQASALFSSLNVWEKDFNTFLKKPEIQALTLEELVANSDYKNHESKLGEVLHSFRSSSEDAKKE
jgi:hypothetical protein